MLTTYRFKKCLSNRKMTNKEELLQIITKLENLKQEKSEVAQTTSDSLAEAKTKG